MRIEITACELKHQKPLQVDYFYFDIEEKFIRYRLKMLASEPKNTEDESLGWEESWTDFEGIALKKYISGTEKSWSELNNNWVVYVFVVGLNQDFRVFFKKQSEAKAFHERLIEYLTT